MANKISNDALAKASLKRWPIRTTKLWPPPFDGGFWIRAQPVDGKTTGPQLSSPGAGQFRTQPDGMWLFLCPDCAYADAVCVEACGSPQNLNDKRSRYIPANHSVVVTCRLAWLNDSVRSAGFHGPRWQAAGTFAQQPPGDITLPIRYLRVLYALKPDHYTDVYAQLIPAGYEFFCRMKSLDSYNSQKMQDFLRQMAFATHFYSHG
jgi:hypothetical protein